MVETGRRGGSDARSPRWARALVIVAGVLAAWAILAAVTGGVRYDIGPIRLSSRNPLRPALVAMLLAVVAWRWHYHDWLEHRLRALSGAGRFAELLIGWAAAALVLVMGVAWGSRAAGGADPHGYVSESALFRHGELKVDQGFAPTMPWRDPQGTFAPLGYRPSSETQVMVPTYAPGLPLLMAAMRSISSCAIYYVGPLSNAVVVILTYFLGRRYFSPAAGLVAAVLTAAAPAMLYMSLLPMADVPAAAFWLAALLAARPTSRAAGFAAGVLTGVAVAIRPNLVPLALFPWLLAIIGARDLRAVLAQTVAFGAGVAPFVALVAWFNNHLYGSPFKSGYGDLSPGFQLAHAPRNLGRYPRWWMESQGPLAFLFLVSLWRRHTVHRRQALVLMAFCAATFLSYVFYIPFEVWWFLRFLLPAVPLAFLFCADAIEWATAHLSLTARFAALVVFTVASLAHAVTFNRHMGLASSGEGEQRYVDAGVFIDRVTPPNAVIISMQHSGSIRYYSGRLTLRYDSLDAGWLDRAIEALERSGRPVYLLLDDWEEPVFRERFAGEQSLRHLDDGPEATGRAGKLLFYTVNAAPFTQTSPRIPRTSRHDCHDISPGFTTAGMVRSP